MVRIALFLWILYFLSRPFEGATPGIHCETCEDYLKRHKCHPLAEQCEKVRRPCGCCDECAGNLNDKCSSYSARCATGLMCVSGKGEALESVPWYMFHYEGTCQNVVVRPVVVENMDVQERPRGRRRS
ncbi:hypothetical protein ScPMuIL_007721 [Solemya velum]